jgi:adenine-specific DNA-methyltransferase
MPARKKRSAPLAAEHKTADYRHSTEKRTNIPPARMAGEGSVPQVPKARYAYSPHLAPTLQFAPTGEPDKITELAEAATKRTLTKEEAARLKAGLRMLDPALEWAGKREHREKGYLEVDPVALHIHERVSARAIVRAALREDVQRDLFADPQQPYQEAVQFYRHDVDWANRIILGDSLQVMSSLARRESLGGKVQMIYMDPPYGIKFASNFQNEIDKKSVGDREQDLTREPEMIRAYRDTWTLGVHSYLSYLADRLVMARELLTDSGSIFVQISDENLHRVRLLLDEVFGRENYAGLITFSATTGQTSGRLSQITDYLIWYAKDLTKMKYKQLYELRPAIDDPEERYVFVETADGQLIDLSVAQKSGQQPVPEGRILKLADPSSQTGSDSSRREFPAFGTSFKPSGSRGWSISFESGMPRVLGAGYFHRQGNSLWWKNYRDAGRLRDLNALWVDTRANAFGDPKRYVVQTPTRVVERCLLMTTEPGDLVLDPTCGSGTTAVTAEQWGRRWISVDTSRVAVSVARQRLLTARFDQYKINMSAGGITAMPNDPRLGFIYRTVPYTSLKSIANNAALDPLIAKHGKVLEERLHHLNAALLRVPRIIRDDLLQKLAKLEREGGKRAVPERVKRSLQLPEKAWQEWEVPFQEDELWTPELKEALRAFRQARREKMDAIDAAIAASTIHEELVDQPEIVKGILRVSGPFTVEGIRPEELNVGEEGLFDGTPNEFEAEENVLAAAAQQQNLQAYLARMAQLIRQDGLTFINNQRRKLAHVEPLFNAGTGGALHAEGAWEGEPTNTYDVAIGFGPQYGPVTALQVEELIRASKRHKELVVAGFSFDADATSLIQQFSSARLRIHQAYIRPDVNPGMDGLLKDTPNSQLFTVFGTPEIEVRKDEEGDWTVELKGVDIYDPVVNTVRSTGANKVAAWFLDSDFDGRCFATTQAFFPDQDAWEKIARALGASADSDAFEAFKGTVSVPFSPGTHKRVAVKVIDPRGNEVMAVRALEG